MRIMYVTSPLEGKRRADTAGGMVVLAFIRGTNLTAALELELRSAAREGLKVHEVLRLEVCPRSAVTHGLEVYDFARRCGQARIFYHYPSTTKPRLRGIQLDTKP